MKTRRSTEFFLPAASAAALLLAAVANTGAEPTNADAKARVPVIEIMLRPAPNFDPENPIIIETIINASDDVPFSHRVPEDIFDWVAMGPELVLFDGEGSEPSSHVADIVSVTDSLWGKPCELPPRKARELVFRIRDRYRIPAYWTNLWVAEDHVCLVLDRKGRVVPEGVNWVLAAGDYVSRQSASVTYEVIERLEPPAEEPDPKAQAAAKARLRWRIAAGALGVVIGLAGLGVGLWRRTHRGMPA